MALPSSMVKLATDKLLLCKSKVPALIIKLAKLGTMAITTVPVWPTPPLMVKLYVAVRLPDNLIDLEVATPIDEAPANTTAPVTEPAVLLELVSAPALLTPVPLR